MIRKTHKHKEISSPQHVSMALMLPKGEMFIAILAST
jgi:hypothetical protein